MSTASLIRLSNFERVPERPFTDAAHSLSDAAILDAMRAGLREKLGAATSDAGATSREPWIENECEVNGRQYRRVILNRQLLLHAGELTVVGFFGHKRGDANPTILQDVDTEMLQEFLHHTYVLSYCSQELPDGNWANLVLLQNPENIAHWRTSPKHAYIARELAPQFYQTIRLHNAVLPGGLGGPQLVLLSTKYYDFSSGWWQAIRDFRSTA